MMDMIKVHRDAGFISTVRNLTAQVQHVVNREQPSSPRLHAHALLLMLFVLHSCLF